MISQLHSIKMIGLEDIVGKAIQNCFENEIKAHKCNRYWMTLLVGTGTFNLLLKLKACKPLTFDSRVLQHSIGTYRSRR